jgi:phage shock protein PspC (stress-responsive transcriptional regulator)
MVTRPRLRRRTQHRLVSGVAGGIADRLNAPVAFVRFVIFFATIPAPWFLWGYAAATVAIPPEGRDRPDWDNVVGLARLGLVQFVPVAALEGGVVLNQPFGGPAGWWIAYLGLLSAGGLALLAADYLRGRPRTREESRRAVLAAVPVAACCAALIAAMLIAPDERWERWLPLVAVVGGGALLVGAWHGRMDGFTAPAMLALALAAAVVAADARLEGGLGDSRVAPGADADGHIVARQAVGELLLDLRHVARDGRLVTVEASVGVGTLRVRLPERRRVQVDARVGRGALEPWMAPGVDSDYGFNPRISRTFGTTRHSGSPAAIRLEAEVGLGKLTIERGS